MINFLKKFPSHFITLKYISLIRILLFHHCSRSWAHSRQRFSRWRQPSTCAHTFPCPRRWWRRSRWPSSWTRRRQRCFGQFQSATKSHRWNYNSFNKNTWRKCIIRIISNKNKNVTSAILKKKNFLHSIHNTYKIWT